MHWRERERSRYDDEEQDRRRAYGRPFEDVDRSRHYGMDPKARDPEAHRRSSGEDGWSSYPGPYDRPRERMHDGDADRRQVYDRGWGGYRPRDRYDDERADSRDYGRRYDADFDARRHREDFWWGRRDDGIRRDFDSGRSLRDRVDYGAHYGERRRDPRDDLGYSTYRPQSSDYRWRHDDDERVPRREPYGEWRGAPRPRYEEEEDEVDRRAESVRRMRRDYEYGGRDIGSLGVRIDTGGR